MLADIIDNWIKVELQLPLTRRDLCSTTETWTAWEYGWIPMLVVYLNGDIIIRKSWSMIGNAITFHVSDPECFNKLENQIVVLKQLLNQYDAAYAG